MRDSRKALKWSLWEKQLVSVGIANGVSYTCMSATLFRGDRRAIAGAVYRWRNPWVKRPWDRPGSRYPIQVATGLDPETAAQVDKFRGTRTRAAALRDLIEWGLEAAEL